MELPLLLILMVIGASSRYIDPIENAGIKNPNLFQGDIILNARQRLAIKVGLDVDGDGIGRGATASRLLVWPTVIPYNIHSTLYNNSVARTAINQAISEISHKTCIRFKWRTSETNYIQFLERRGCWSYVGCQGGKQLVSLGPGCWSKGTAVHEIVHALGFWHEQSRPDRDQYITINWANIQSGQEDSFKRHSSSKINSLGAPYDYGSVMHYQAYAFTKNGKPTIVAKRPWVTLGNRNGLSSLDAYQIKKLYKCCAWG